MINDLWSSARHLSPGPWPWLFPIRLLPGPAPLAGRAAPNTATDAAYYPLSIVSMVSETTLKPACSNRGVLG